ncbi:MAG TPA: hypothetical protein PKN57_12410 [Saprospiraceae bacterium]|jgi:hypothetical protein|nr:hypothetical protein [Saprospiraceae bacterium]HMW74780.1 hypothetical protein [Saprospiraceae bacterium]HMX83609.1 hypothetical protein [Saprospiraceae bacterium]HMX86328.1 hypothetical protein [Saprospiraceae bacterium]HMZ73035.1 hypothetical protein [Saprospiraceae bacterium]
MSNSLQDENLSQKSKVIVYFLFFLFLVIAAIVMVMKRGYQLEF